MTESYPDVLLKDQQIESLLLTLASKTSAVGLAAAAVLSEGCQFATASEQLSLEAARSTLLREFCDCDLGLFLLSADLCSSGLMRY